MFFQGLETFFLFQPLVCQVTSYYVIEMVLNCINNLLLENSKLFGYTLNLFSYNSFEVFLFINV